MLFKVSVKRADILIAHRHGGFKNELARFDQSRRRMQELEAQQAELQTAESRYAEVKAWLDSFAAHIKSGAILNADDDMIVKQLVEQIIINDDSIEIQFKCGTTVTKEYEAA